MTKFKAWKTSKRISLFKHAFSQNNLFLKPYLGQYLLKTSVLFNIISLKFGNLIQYHIYNYLISFFVKCVWIGWRGSVWFILAVTTNFQKASYWFFWCIIKKDENLFYTNLIFWGEVNDVREDDGVIRKGNEDTRLRFLVFLKQ